MIRCACPRVLGAMARPPFSRFPPSSVHTCVALALLAALPSCNKASASARPTPTSPRPTVTLPSTPPSAAAVAAKDDIAGLFHAEARQRPTGTVHVEDALVAFESAGVETTDVRQHLAKPFGADYCAGAEAGHGVVLSLCEYADPAAASAGRAASAKGLATIPHREIVQNGATTLTLRERSRTPESQAVVERLKRAFGALKA